MVLGSVAPAGRRLSRGHPALAASVRTATERLYRSARRIIPETVRTRKRPDHWPGLHLTPPTLGLMLLHAMVAGLAISSCGSNFKVVPIARETRHSFSARFSSSSARSRSSLDAIFRLGRTTI